MFIQLTSEQIRKLHEYVLEQDGGLSGDKEPGLIDLIADKPFTDYFGEEQYPGLFMKAAVYMHGFATQQTRKWI